MGAWIETYHNKAAFVARLVAPYVGAWIETFSGTTLLTIASSHPTWVRGLKPSLLSKCRLRPWVAPYVGAWIET